MTRALAAIAVVLALAAPARADEAFRAANEAYRSADYERAIELYEQLVATGARDPDLFYNLGNAYYRSAGEQPHRLGRAIFNYERALRLDPGMDDARFNLEVAREVVGTRIEDRLVGAEHDPFWIREATRFTIGELCVAFAAAMFAFFGVLIWVRFLPAGFLRTGLMVANAFVAIGALYVAIMLGGHIAYLETVDVGIVLDDEAVIREGPDHNRVDTGQVHAGLRVRLIDREPGWVRVRLANGVEGWLPARGVGEL